MLIICQFRHSKSIVCKIFCFLFFGTLYTKYFYTLLIFWGGGGGL